MSKKKKKKKKVSKKQSLVTAKIEVEEVPFDDINPAEYNPRKMTQQVIDDVMASIMEFGFSDPVIANRRLEKNGFEEDEDGDLVMVGGHKRLLAVKALYEEEEWTRDTIPCVIRELTPSQEKALNVALNKIQDEFDLKLLSQVVEDIQSDRPELIKRMGFREKELTGLMIDPKVEAVKFGDVAEEFLQSHPEEATTSLWLYMEPRSEEEFQRVKDVMGNPSNRMLDMDKVMKAVDLMSGKKKKKRRR